MDEHELKNKVGHIFITSRGREYTLLGVTKTHCFIRDKFKIDSRNILIGQFNTNYTEKIV